jgi:mannose-6-phosphate isomerase-like protein (cupin superfamily)
VPVFRSGAGQAPAWCELRFFEVATLPPGARHAFERVGRKERIVVSRGACRLAAGEQTVTLAERGRHELAVPDGRFVVEEVLSQVTLVRLCGDWGERTGGCGLFVPVPSDGQPDKGDPVPYPKATAFDSHYHDCDEYWIILEGRGVAVSEGKRYVVGPGDCVATGMGHHHDFPEVFEPVRAAYFETTLEGQRRRGHLWSHTHGPAAPRPDRV